MRHLDDPLLAADRIVRRGLGVRDGQTIRDRAWEITRGGIGDWRLAAAALAVISEDTGWDGTRRAAEILSREGATQP